MPDRGRSVLGTGASRWLSKLLAFSAGAILLSAAVTGCAPSPYATLAPGTETPTAVGGEPTSLSAPPSLFPTEQPTLPSAPSVSPTATWVTPTQVASSPPPSEDSAGRGVVYLTFDDGPSEWTPRVQRILADEGIQATFFTVGQNVAALPTTVQALQQGGMSVQSHSWSHRDLTTLKPGRLADDLSRTTEVIRNVSGVAPTCVRPPYGAHDKKVDKTISKLGLRAQYWDVDPEDWSKPGAKKIVKRVLAKAKAGSVILLHDGGGDRDQTIKALPSIINGLRDKGFRFGVLCQD